MAGIAAAYHLAVRGGVKDILLVDEREPLTLTSNKGTEAYRNWWPGPGDTMVRFVNRSIDLLEELAEETDNCFQMNRRGYVFLTADEGQIPIMKYAAAETSALGAGPIREHPGPTPYIPSPSEGFEGLPTGVDLLLSPDLVREQFPAVTEDAIAALHVRRAGWLDAQKLGKWLLAEAQRAGVRLVRDRVRGVTVTDNRVAQVAASIRGSYQYRHLRHRCGTRISKRLARCWGWTFPFSMSCTARLPSEMSWELCRRTHRCCFGAIRLTCLGPTKSAKSSLRMTRPVGCSMNFPLAFISGHAWTATPMYFSPSGRMILNPCPPVWPPTFDPDYPEILIRGLARMIPGLSAYFGHGNRAYADGGYYCKTRENRPLIGPLPVEGAYVIGGLSGYGIMTSQAAGELLATHITGGELPEYAPAFLFSRYADPIYQAY